MCVLIMFVTLLQEVIYSGLSAPHATYKKGAGILKETPGNYEVHRVRIQADERLDEVPGEQANSTACKNGGGPEALEPLLGLRRLPPALRRCQWHRAESHIASPEVSRIVFKDHYSEVVQ